jgi:hypothetical protein
MANHEMHETTTITGRWLAFLENIACRTSPSAFFASSQWRCLCRVRVDELHGAHDQQGVAQL